MQTAAQVTRTANDGAKLELDPFAPSAATAWVAEGPQRQGSRSILSVTDTASAARYGLQTASLSRAGDNGGGRAFVPPDQAGLLAGASAMVQSPVEGVLQPNPATATSAAYPLTLLTYGAVTPGRLDQPARNDYAAFIEYAAGPGQVPGLHFGELPPGYAPLPDALRAQARDAAAAIRAGGQAPGSSNSLTSSSRSGSSGIATGSSGRAAGLNSTGAAGGAGAGSAAGAQNPASPARASSTSSTPSDSVGLLRYVLPAIVAVGLLSNLGALALNEPKKKMRGPRPPPPSGSL
jgi:hypothetical protein